jgi:hypothetical protein
MEGASSAVAAGAPAGFGSVPYFAESHREGIHSPLGASEKHLISNQQSNCCASALRAPC